MDLSSRGNVTKTSIAHQHPGAPIGVDIPVLAAREIVPVNTVVVSEPVRLAANEAVIADTSEGDRPATIVVVAV